MLYTWAVIDKKTGDVVDTYDFRAVARHVARTGTYFGILKITNLKNLTVKRVKAKVVRKIGPAEPI